MTGSARGSRSSVGFDGGEISSTVTSSGRQTVAVQAIGRSRGWRGVLSARVVLEEDRRGIEAARQIREPIAEAAEWVAETLHDGGTVLFAGAGTSGRLGVLEAAESTEHTRHRPSNGRCGLPEAGAWKTDSPSSGRSGD